MLRFLRLASAWRVSRQQDGAGRDGNEVPAVPARKWGRNRSKQHPTVESVESRILLSAADLRSHLAGGSADVFRSAQSSALITAVSGIAVQHGSPALSATLTSDGAPLAGKTIRFLIRGRAAGKATTDDQGIAVLSSGTARGLSVGKYPRAVVAVFAGDSGHRPATGRGSLTVSRFGTHLSLIFAGGVFGGNGTVAAVLTFNGSPLPGMTIGFQIMGQTVGTVRTNAFGIATLPNVSLAGLNAGVYANQASASFMGSATYRPNRVSADLSVSQGQATFNVGSLSQTYDGTAKSVTFTSSPSDIATRITYVDASGKTVANPTAAGTYQFLLVSTSPNFVGSATGVLTVAQRAITVSGITANDKVYDGTTMATGSLSSAALVGVVPGDDVSLNESGAMGTFASKNVGTGITVTVSGLALSGAAAGNYVLITPTTTASITAAPLSVTGITASDKVYDGSTVATLNTTGAALVGVFTGDDVTLDVSGATGSFGTKTVGTGKAVTIAGLMLGGTSTGNYVLVQPATTASITAASLSVSGVTAANKVYDGSTDATLNTSGATLVGVLTGDSVSLDASMATGTFASKNVGTAVGVNVSGLTLSGSDAGNYTLTQPSTTADITPAMLSVNGITADKVYDGNTTATLNTSGATLVGVIGFDDVSLSSSGATGMFATKNVGTGITVSVSGLTLTGADAGNYVLTQPTLTANITAATLTVSGITAADKAFDGNTNATLDTTNAMLVGVVPPDDVTLGTANAIGMFDSPDVGANKTVFITGLSISGPDAGNYTLTQPTTTASIT
jgi:trimeric autotransporter adhesin